MIAIAILLLVGAVALGFFEGRNSARIFIVMISGATIMGASNLLASWPWFLSDTSTWIRTYWTGLLSTGVASFVMHLVPFVIAYLIGKRTRSATS